jgi:hypothetical protein
MLRCASSFVIAAYATVRPIPQDSRALPAAFLRNHLIFSTFKTFYEVVTFPPGSALRKSRNLQTLFPSSPPPAAPGKGKRGIDDQGGGFYHSSKPRAKGNITNLPRGIPYHLPLARARNDLLCPGRFYIFQPDGVLVLSGRLSSEGGLIHPWRTRPDHLLHTLRQEGSTMRRETTK